MNKKSVRIISTILTVLMLVMATMPVFAANTASKDPFSGVDPSTNGINITGVQDTGNKILGMMQTVGTIIAVGVLMVLGIKYMMGSAEEKASYKKTMIPYLVGAVLIFAATNIASMVYDFTSKI